MNHLCMKLDLLSNLVIGFLALLKTSSGDFNFQNSIINEYEENPEITWLNDTSLLYDWLDQQVSTGKKIDSKGKAYQNVLLSSMFLWETIFIVIIEFSKAK